SDLDLSLDNSENEKEDLTQEHTALDTDPNLDELEDENSENLEIKDNQEIEKQEELLDDSKVNTPETQEKLDEAQDSHDASKTLDTQNLEDENLEQETTKEQTEEDVESDLDL
ncbi:highly acidic protein, partial [Campylobacter jejuni]|nr:highly acidic protein [Campylobacter jejuni]MCW1359666.1 highly acidic protein [Campylobacter jejuni]